MAALPLGAESLDKVWIISENTGNPATFVKRDQPNLDAGEIIQVYFEQSGLSAKWGEGWVPYGYSWFTDKGKKVWSSKELDAKKKSSDETWKLSSVVPVAVPADLPAGKYRIEFSVTDYHTRKNYLGNIHFTVGMPSAQAEQPAQTASASVAATDSAAPADDDAYTGYIDNVRMTLISAVKRSNKLILKFDVLNEGDKEQSLQVDPYKSFVSDANRKEFYFSKWDCESTLIDSHTFYHGVPAYAELTLSVAESFKGPVSYLMMAFNYTSNEYKVKNFPLPFQKE